MSDRERENERVGDYLTSHMLHWIIRSIVAETMTAERRRLKTAGTGRDHSRGPHQERYTPAERYTHTHTQIHRRGMQVYYCSDDG